MARVTSPEGGYEVSIGAIDYILAAHFENSDTITDGSPAGYNSNADQTWNRTAAFSYSSAQYQDGGYSLYCNTGAAGDNAQINVDANINAGTMDFYVYVTARNRYSTLIRLYADADNWVGVWFQDTNTLALEYQGNNVSVSVNAGANQLSLDSWHHVVFKWRTGVTDPSLWMQIDSNTAVTSNTDLTAIIGTPYLRIHEYYSGNNTFYIDNLILYTTWQ